MAAFSVLLILYGLSFLSGLTLLTALAQVDFLQGIFFKSITGGTAGGLTAWYFAGVSPFLSFTESALNGDLGAGGYAYVFSLVFLMFVWGFNMSQQKGAIQ
jgi:hypothetical protein